MGEGLFGLFIEFFHFLFLRTLKFSVNHVPCYCLCHVRVLGSFIACTFLAVKGDIWDKLVLQANKWIGCASLYSQISFLCTSVFNAFVLDYVHDFLLSRR